MSEGFTNTKTCTQCEIEKPYSEFYRSVSHADGYRGWCKQCCNGYSKVWAEQNQQLRLNQDRMRKYGVTPEEYDALWEMQGGICAICKQPETARGRNGAICELSVDHDHEGGTVRGLLCKACNMGLGQFRDDPARLRAALQYLADSSSDDDDTRAAEPHGEVSPEHGENSGSTPTAATKLILPEGPESSVCIWCLKQPCQCSRLRFERDEPAPGTDVG